MTNKTRDNYKVIDRVKDWFSENPDKVVCSHILSEELGLKKDNLYHAFKKLMRDNFIRKVGKEECPYYDKRHNKYVMRGDPDHVPRGKLNELPKTKKVFQKLLRNFDVGEEFTTQDVGEKFGEELDRKQIVHDINRNSDAIQKVGKDGRKNIYKIVSKDYDYKKRESNKTDETLEKIKEEFEPGDKFTIKELVGNYSEMSKEAKARQSAVLSEILKRKEKLIKKVGKMGKMNLYKVTEKKKEEYGSMSEELFYKLKKEFGMETEFSTKDVEKKFGKKEAKRIHSIDANSDSLKKVGKKRKGDLNTMVNIYEIISEGYHDEVKEDKTKPVFKAKPVLPLNRDGLKDAIKRKFKKGRIFTWKDIKDKYQLQASNGECLSRIYNLANDTDFMKIYDDSEYITEYVIPKELESKDSKLENKSSQEEKTEEEEERETESKEPETDVMEKLKRSIKEIKEKTEENEKRIDGIKITEERKEKDKLSKDKKIIVRTLYKQTKVLEEIVTD